jgi:RimJ/RimL family protein N-acetyltransferase
VFLAAFRRVAEGSLDVTTVVGRAAVGADRQAREAMRHYLGMPGPRDWWRLAYTPQGSLAGLAIPSRNPDGPVAGYLGVVPELRGHGYVDDLLAEITHLLARAGALQIQADTDLVNRPMAAAFERARYRNHAVRMVLYGA